MVLISIPRVPPSPNVLKRKYRTPHTYKKLREEWEHDLYYGVSCGRHRSYLRDNAKMGRMWVQITVHHSKPFDADNLQGSQKVILDALRNLEYIADDSQDKLNLIPAEQIIGKEKKTVVKIGVVDE